MESRLYSVLMPYGNPFLFKESFFSICKNLPSKKRYAPSDTIVMGFTWSWMDKRCYVCTPFDLSCFNGSDNPSDWDWSNTHWNLSCGRPPENPYTNPLYAWIWNSAQLGHDTRIEIENFKNPIFITHGSKDELWEYERSLRIKQTLEAAGLSPEVHIFQGEQHVFRFPAENIRKELLLSFFQRTIQE